MVNYYNILSLKPDATPEEIKSKFTKKIKRKTFLGISSRKIAFLEKLKLAFDNLIDPAKRNQHDIALGLYQASDPAPWRQHYIKYTSADLQKDVEYSTKIFEELIRELDRPQAGLGFALIFIVILAAGGTYYVYDKYLSSTDLLKKNFARMNPTGSPQLVKQVFSQEEQVLSEQLSPERQQELMALVKQVELLKVAPNFPDLINNCKIHMEPVSLAEELLIKYQGLLTCLQQIAKS